MNGKLVGYILYTLLFLGILIGGSGVYLVVFTDFAQVYGISGVMTEVGLIAGGLFVSIPAKVLLTLRLMSQRSANTAVNSSSAHHA